MISIIYGKSSNCKLHHVDVFKIDIEWDEKNKNSSKNGDKYTDLKVEHNKKN